VEVTGRRRSAGRRAAGTKGIKVIFDIRADDTGRDKTPNSNLKTEIDKPENQAAAVATAGSYMSAAQTSNANATKLTDGSYSNTEELKKIQDACSKGQCKEYSLTDEEVVMAVALIIVIAVVGGCCCCCIPAGVIVYCCMVKPKKAKVVDPEFDARSGPVAVPNNAPAATGGGGGFCKNCGAQVGAGTFCASCGQPY